MDERRFEAVAVAVGSRVVIPLPFEPAEAWGARERYHVSGTIAGNPWRGTLERDGGGVCGVALGPAWRRDNGVEVGARVGVVLAPEGPQLQTMGEDVVAALRDEPAARAFFEALPTFYRNNYLRWLSSAKRPETRARRVAELVGLLRDHRRER